MTGRIMSINIPIAPLGVGTHRMSLYRLNWIFPITLLSTSALFVPFSMGDQFEHGHKRHTEVWFYIYNIMIFVLPDVMEDVRLWTRRWQAFMEFSLHLILCTFFWVFPRFRNPLSGPSSKASWAFEDGPDRGFQNVGTTHSDAGEIPKRKYTRFRTRRKFEIKNCMFNSMPLIFF
jgi:hypothetical protein